MAVDNELYDRMAATWWDPHGLLHVLKALNPARFGYMRRVLLDERSLSPAGLTALDVGCGGGLLAEEFARLGFQVTGVDPSPQSLATARAHAAGAGLSIDYRQATAEALPFEAGIFDVVYCCDVLEHVADLPRVIQESARVLRPGGVYLFDTINRTVQSKLIMIKLFQEWRWTSFMPANLHDWQMFIRPSELIQLLERNGLRASKVTGLKPRANPLQVIRVLRARKLGRLSYHEAAQGMDLGESSDTSVLYIGYAQKPGVAPAAVVAGTA